MHKVYESLWKNEMVEFYRLMDYKWSQGAEVMFELKEKVQQENIQLVSYAYSSIQENVFAEMTNLSPEAIVETCKQLNWEILSGPSPRLIIPKKPVIDKVSALDAEDQLRRLTGYVSYLEN